jgi:DNA polymerase delta subunit 1
MRTEFTRDDEMALSADRYNETWAPFRLMVFDMECLPKACGGFPEAAVDPIIQISVVMDYDMLRGQSASCHLWTWRPTSMIQIDEFDPSGCHVHVLESEGTMLRDFVHFIQGEDPDVISGWNVQGFDLPYLMERCAALRVSCHLSRGDRPTRLVRRGVVIPGRVVADMLPMWRAQHTERSYRLGDVCERHLGASKAPVHYSDMRRMWDEDRDPLATYCLKDSWLVWRLGVTRSVWMNAFQMAKVTFVPLDRIVNGGQQIRVFTLLTHHAHRAGVYIPDAVPECTVGYKGAVVLSPLPGLYRDCVVTLDFASLYPSIMMAFNMCYTTQRNQVAAWELARSLRVPLAAAQLILDYTDVAVAAIPADAREYHRCGDVAFKREPRGILPTILDTLLKRRKAAKREMAQSEGLAKAIANGKQLALKLVANSIYGFTGAAELGMLPQPQIAAAVTYMGRKLTIGTKALCEKEEGVTCVYGGKSNPEHSLDVAAC